MGMPYHMLKKLVRKPWSEYATTGCQNFVPRNCVHAYAAWVVPHAPQRQAQARRTFSTTPRTLCPARREGEAAAAGTASFSPVAAVAEDASASAGESRPTAERLMTGLMRWSARKHRSRAMAPRSTVPPKSNLRPSDTAAAVPSA